MTHVNRRDQCLMLLARRGHDMDLRFETGAYALLRLSVAGAATERETLRRHVQQHAILLEPHFRGERDGVSQILGVNLAGTAKFVETAALPTVNIRATDAHRHGFDRDPRAAFGIRHRRVDRFGHGFLIGNAALGPTGGRRQAMAQVAELVPVEGADHAARAGTARVQTHRELYFLVHAIRPP